MVGIICFNNIRLCPYLNYYKKIFDDAQIKYDVYYFDRNKLQEVDKENYFKIKWFSSQSNFSKVFNFYYFYLHMSKILKMKNYDLIVVLTTMPSIILSKILLCKYKKRYIVDVRDYTHENNRKFYNIEEKVFANSYLNIISSEGYKQFLPKLCTYLICHNFNYSLQDMPVIVDNKRKVTNKIIIGYIGNIAYLQQCKALISLVVNDSRFCFYFWGSDSTGCIEDVIRNTQNERIKYFGAYNPSEKGSIISSCNLMFNCYGNDSLLVKTAISNKFYDSLIYMVPLLTSPNTYMSDMCGGYSFDMDFDSCDDLNELYQWYISFDWKGFDVFSKKTIDKTILENERTKIKILDFFKDDSRNY